MNASLQETIARLQARAARRLGAESSTALAFVSHYFRRADPADISGMPEDDLYGAVMSHWQLLQVRTPGVPRVRVFNPSVAQQGWQSAHTVIEIVNDDMPFLVDSLTHEINRQGLTMHWIVHPAFEVRRDDSGRLQAIGDEAPGGPRESVIHAEVDRRGDDAALGALVDGISRVLADVRAAVTDWQPMIERLGAVARELREVAVAAADGDRGEQVAFLDWLAGGHFTLLGYRGYDLVGGEGEESLRAIPDSALGILREAAAAPTSASFASLPPDLRQQARSPQALIVTKSNSRATVHRPGYLDFVGVKRFDAAGRVVGEHRFLGLFTSAAYSTSPWQIPLLRHKVQQVVERAGFRPDSHAGKALKTIIEQYPRDELIQMTVDELYETAIGILQLGERQRVRLFIRRDAFRRFFSCLVLIPRDRYDTALRLRIQAILLPALGGVSSEHHVLLSDSVLARLHLIVRGESGADIGIPDLRELEAKIAEAARDWDDDLAAAIVAEHGEERGAPLVSRYRGAFPASYREQEGARSALADIALCEAASGPDAIAVSLYLPPDAAGDVLRLKIARLGTPLVLSESMPMLENLGVRVVDEQPHRVQRRDADPVWIHDFGLRHGSARERLSLDRLRALTHEAFLQIWRGEVENDRFNALVLAAGLDWRRIKMLRAYGRYMRQAGGSFSTHYLAATLCAYPQITADLAALFETRFDPALTDVDRQSRCERLAGGIEAALAEVQSLDDDRILRQYLALIQATLRTSYYRREGGDLRHYLSFKFDPSRIPGLPEPRPAYEIFVFSPRVEGVHLRGGNIARGGLRWSDRLEDYRTEVLGLVKAQMVKNAVIVPAGSKGGFVVKRPPAGGDREALLKEGVACYQVYLRGLLDLTDNRVEGRVVPPPEVVRHDGDDPYLVVAADKGTATFSDIANGVAAEYRFWLGDAFASGGSAGYDHKKMGITARGAWESVKHHFRQLGVDTQNQDFTVVGVGDMSGDVFGNGMLLSRHIRLVAAFDHRHVFIDPNPDAASSFVERERLFGLARSSWDDYDRKLISPGGGVWPRSAKRIPLSPEARAALAVDADALSPAELISAILRAPVDLLYNGGIGTYVKSVDETHAQVGDRANDAVRIDAAELRCRVIGEGGNLGLTQRARIEFAAAGGRVYTDAIDNSGGVDCSDHEVNIKILLGAVVAAGDMTGKQRDRLLADMTEEVAALVLQDNIQQTRVLSAMAARAPQLFEEQVRYLHHLERSGRLIRRLEFLPNDEAIEERRRAGQGLWLPELAVLLAYSKIELFAAVLESDAPDDRIVARALVNYFPEPLRIRFAPQIAAHPLRREIVATAVTNELINRTGCTFPFRLAQETGAEGGAIVRAYVLAREVFGLGSLWQALDDLDAVPADTQRAIGATLARQAERAALWFLRRPLVLADLAASIESFLPVVTEVRDALDSVLREGERAALDEAVARHRSQGVPEELARAVATLTPVHAALDLHEIVRETGRSPAVAAGAYFDLVGRLDLYWLSRQIHALSAASRWEERARGALRDDLEAVVAQLTAWVFRQCEEPADACDSGALIDAWQAAREAQLARYQRMMAELKPQGRLDWAMVSVLLRELKALAREA